MENINRKCIFEEKLKTGEVINTETDLFLWLNIIINFLI
jgi:hypothetical protein